MKHPPTVFIYALLDPRDGEVRYIGKSRSPRERYHHHGSVGGASQWVKAWQDELRALGLRPKLQILCEVPKEVGHDAERDAIHVAVLSGCNLLNVANLFVLKNIWGLAAA